MTRSSANGWLSEEARGTAELTLEKSVVSKVARLSSIRWSAAPARIGSRGRIVRAASPIVRELAPIGSRDAISERSAATSVASQSSRSAIASWVVNTRTSPRASSPEVSGRPVIEALRRYLLNPCACATCAVRRCRRSTPSRRRQSRSLRPLADGGSPRDIARDGAAVHDGNDDGNHAGVAATTNWYAKNDGRTRPIA